MEPVSPCLADGVLTLTLGGGPAHPLSRGMISALHRAVTAAQDDPAVRVLVIHGPGRIFCAGHDLKEIAAHRADPDGGAAYLTDLFDACAVLMQALVNSRKPTIAQVEGIATAAGLQLVAACDLAFAGPGARFCLPGIRRGGFCTSPAVAVGRRLGQGALMDLLLSGDEKPADWALRHGLVTAVVPDADLGAHVADRARTLAARFSPVAEAGLAATRAQLALPLADAYALASRAMVAAFLDPALPEPRPLYARGP